MGVERFKVVKAPGPWSLTLKPPPLPFPPNNKTLAGRFGSRFCGQDAGTRRAFGWLRMLSRLASRGSFRGLGFRVSSYLSYSLNSLKGGFYRGLYRGLL